MTHKGNILCVDDTLASLRMLSDTLSAEGYTVRSAQSSEAALRAAKLSPPELILLDVRMPGMDGFEACRQLKVDPKTSSTPVIFLSAATETADRVKGLAVGAVDFIGKPFQREELLARVHTQITLHRLSSQLESQVVARTRELQGVLNAALEVSIVVTDTQGRVTKFNHGAERMLGYNEQEMLGQSPLRIHVDGEVKRRAQELGAQLARPVAGFEVLIATVGDDTSDIRNWTYVTKDGKRLRVSLAISRVRDPLDEVTGFLFIGRDISAQLAAQSELLQLNLQLDYRVKERTDELEKTLLDLRQTQGKLAQAERLAGLGKIVSAVAHELNTPIGNCLTVASTMEDKSRRLLVSIDAGSLRRSDLSDYAQSTIDSMQLLEHGLNRAAQLVSNFKLIAVDQYHSRRCPFVLDEVVDAVVAGMRGVLNSTPYQVSLDIAAALNMDGYPESLEHVITHLVNNSLVHGFDGRDHGVIRIQANADGDSVHLDYSDDGVGMSDDVQRHVFDPFFTTRFGKGGSGLGMSICYNLITSLMGGTIGVTSSPGQGCVFHVVIPRVAPQAAQ